MTRDRIHHVLFLCTGNSARGDRGAGKSSPDLTAVDRSARFFALPIEFLDGEPPERRAGEIGGCS